MRLQVAGVEVCKPRSTLDCAGLAQAHVTDHSPWSPSEVGNEPVPGCPIQYVILNPSAKFLTDRC